LQHLIVASDRRRELQIFDSSHGSGIRRDNALTNLDLHQLYNQAVAIARAACREAGLHQAISAALLYQFCTVEPGEVEFSDFSTFYFLQLTEIQDPWKERSRLWPPQYRVSFQRMAEEVIGSIPIRSTK
jgi:hypothetical protein